MSYGLHPGRNWMRDARERRFMVCRLLLVYIELDRGILSEVYWLQFSSGIIASKD